MDPLTRELEQLRATDHDLAQLLKTYQELDQVYRGSLEAMGITNTPTITVQNSAEITVSFDRPEHSSSRRW